PRRLAAGDAHVAPDRLAVPVDAAVELADGDRAVERLRVLLGPRVGVVLPRGRAARELRPRAAAVGEAAVEQSLDQRVAGGGDDADQLVLGLQLGEERALGLAVGGGLEVAAVAGAEVGAGGQ